ncbi:hypothetical protein [Ponticaulis sp.]|uniref:tautomerase family protein n=1 Tax=Ponticaulis sp. TaxID=2020902 RepID=UPI000B64BC23|nr:hypothetical protein [Ponticaulis sp.]MAI91247.1 4-oxalocrotonate tautomerase [Ponticaulis sp.]OUX98558.1 MAG: hypothetical protein CBB65_12450 [Hyphomonadaceae bacterium TMED5]|tara:strand:- start:32965 stop:33393 length:429 start_codon:yes stop_codon:yes gene_type:complete
MPIVNFHLVEGQQTDASIKQLLIEAGEMYLDVFYPDQEPRPVARLRAFATMIKPEHFATAGVFMDEGGEHAPYFTFLALAGRPPEQHAALIKGFTDLLVKHVSCEAKMVRGMAVPIEPDLWGIGGRTASDIRKAEIEARSGT